MTHSSYDHGNRGGGELESRIETIESQILSISERNRRVELNKAWETSRTRLCSITVITYITMVLVFSVLGSARAFLDALVPTTGFFLSTLSLPVIRRAWERRSMARE
jgi:hypothetical protein